MTEENPHSSITLTLDRLRFLLPKPSQIIHEVEETSVEWIHDPISFCNLAELRTQLIGMDASEVAKLTSINLERLNALETTDAPAVWELEKLSDLYGIDATLLADQPIKVGGGRSILYIDKYGSIEGAHVFREEREDGTWGLTMRCLPLGEGSILNWWSRRFSTLPREGPCRS